MSEPNRIMVRQKTANEIIIRIAREITEPDDFADEFQILAAADEQDTVKIQLITPGGRVDTAHLLCRAIRECRAHTVAYIGPICASAGTSIALACEEWEVDDMSEFMVHTGSYGAYGMAPHVKAKVTHEDKMIERWVRNSYTGFLTEEEILKVLDAREVYFEGEELANRLLGYAIYRDEKRAEAMEEMEAELAELQEKIAQAQPSKELDKEGDQE